MVSHLALNLSSDPVNHPNLPKPDRQISTSLPALYPQVSCHSFGGTWTNVFLNSMLCSCPPDVAP